MKPHHEPQRSFSVSYAIVLQCVFNTYQCHCATKTINLCNKTSLLPSQLFFKTYQSVQQNLTIRHGSCFSIPVNLCKTTSPCAITVVFQYLSICATKPHHVPLQLFFNTCQSVQQNLTMCDRSCFSIPINLCNKTSPCSALI